MNSFVFHEPKQHGTPDFPFEYFYVDQTHPRYSMPFHWHKEWEIIYVLEGTFTAHADDAVFTAQKGDILLIRGGMLHGGTPENCVYECFLFDLHGLYRNLDMVKKHLRSVYHQQILPHIYFPAGTEPGLADSIYRLSDACKRTEPNYPLELVVHSCILQFFSLILQSELLRSHRPPAADVTHKIDLIKSILEYIEVNYASAISLSDLADVAKMNTSYFCRFFRSITHQSPMEYVNMYRIEKAAQMLHTTQLPVMNICLECGFNECSNFIKVFKKYKGVTPSQYRKG